MKTIYYVFGFTSIIILIGVIANLAYYLNYTSRSTPIFPSKYIAEGIIIVSNTTYKQPFQVWYNFDEGIHRQDYYKGMLITLNVRKNNIIQSYDFFPIYTETLKNQIFCNTSILDKGSKLDSFLPDLSNNYHQCGEEIIQGIKTEKWCNKTEVSKQTVYIQLKNSSSEPHKQISVPVMIEMESNVNNESIIFTRFSDSKADIKFLTEPLKRESMCINTTKLFNYFHNNIYEDYYEEFNLQAKDYTNLPETFDWREYGAVSEVKNQAIDGPCWTFAATGAVESAYLKRTNGTKKMDLSEQAALDCTWDFDSLGHYGGFAESVFRWMIQRGGIPTEEEYGPYLAKGGYCHADEVYLTAPISSWSRLPSEDCIHNHTIVKAALKRYGPLVAMLYTSTDSFINYSKSDGIYNDPKCKTTPKDMNHYVLLVGYGKQNQTEYWIIKNSWGSHWGDQGYAYIAIENNVCGLMNDIILVIV